MKILIVEDDQQLIQFMEKGFTQAGFVVESATDGAIGYEKALDKDIDCAIVDIMLPLMDGFSLIQELRKKRPSLPILVLSAKKSVEDRVKGLDLGSDDYLTKPFSFSELQARVRALLRRRGGKEDERCLCVGDLRIDLVSREVTMNGEKIGLTPKEFSLIEYLARNKGRIITRMQILDRIWGYRSAPKTNLVDVHICRLREKIRDTGATFIRTIRNVGYSMDDVG